jgi:regulator of protease activity HflC (stomatin/prohibitin superfamily)
MGTKYNSFFHKLYCKVKDYDKSTRLLAATTLRTILGMKSLTEILSDRDSISQDILHLIENATAAWGIKVHTNNFPNSHTYKYSLDRQKCHIY